MGINSDSERKHVNFRKKYDLPFDLIADTDLTIHHLYGTWGEKQMYGRKFMGTYRITFVISENGTIEEVISKVKTKDHTTQIIK